MIKNQSAFGVRLLAGWVALGAMIARADEGRVNDPLGPMNLVLTDMAMAQDTIEPGVIERIGDLIDIDADVLQRASLYTATNQPRKGEPFGVHVLVLPLDDVVPDGRLGIAVREDSGAVVKVALWGAEVFEENRDGVWSAFCGQFRPPAGMGSTLDLGSALSASEIGQAARLAAHDSGPSGVALATMYSHRMLMLGNSARFYTLGRYRANEETPSDEWFESWSEALSEIGARGEALEPIIGGQAVAIYESTTTKGQELLRVAQEQSRAGESDSALAQLQSGMFRQVCIVCHDSSAHDVSEGMLYDVLPHRFEAEGMRTDLAVVGLDLWAPERETEREMERETERELAQQLGYRVRAGLLILGAD